MVPFSVPYGNRQKKESFMNNINQKDDQAFYSISFDLTTAFDCPAELQEKYKEITHLLSSDAEKAISILIPLTEKYYDDPLFA